LDSIKDVEKKKSAVENDSSVAQPLPVFYFGASFNYNCATILDYIKKRRDTGN
jgi:hypothetical protein